MVKSLLQYVAFVAALSFASALNMSGAGNMSDVSISNHTAMNSSWNDATEANSTAAVTPPAMPPSTTAPTTLGTIGSDGQCVCPSPAASNEPAGIPGSPGASGNSSIVPTASAPSGQLSSQNPPTTTEGPTAGNETSAAATLNTPVNTCLLAIAGVAGLHVLAA